MIHISILIDAQVGIQGATHILEKATQYEIECVRKIIDFMASIAAPDGLPSDVQIIDKLDLINKKL